MLPSLQDMFRDYYSAYDIHFLKNIFISVVLVLHHVPELVKERSF
jgi:hypothetical protein